MRRGFSLLELILALTVLQIGLLATVGMIVLAQSNFLRSELTLRGVLESAWTADSLAALGELEAGARVTPWGGVSWSVESSPVPFVRVSAWTGLDGDTVARAAAFPTGPRGDRIWPNNSQVEGGR